MYYSGRNKMGVLKTKGENLNNVLKNSSGFQSVVPGPAVSEWAVNLLERQTQI